MLRCLIACFVVLIPISAAAETLSARCQAVWRDQRHMGYECSVTLAGRSVAIRPDDIARAPAPGLVAIRLHTDAGWPGLDQCERWPRNADGECRPDPHQLVTYGTCRRPSPEWKHCPPPRTVTRWLQLPRPRLKMR